MSVTGRGRVAGKRALITGAAGGLGAAMGWMLAREGAKVALTDVNLSGVEALASGAASIINISSVAGLAAAPGMGAYNATKAAVWMYTKTVALEGAKQNWNVRCNSVHPVFIKTPILDPFIAMAGGDETTAHQKLARGIPLKRIGEPDDVAWCVLYLASDESKFVTGAEFKIDGGMLAQ